jgi:acyl-coenzyme A synthetase/AMP-(fatty) acid ligase
MTDLPLILGADLAAPLAWVQGRPISRARFLADVERLAAQLPPGAHLLNLSGDRYRFAVGLGAALLRGQDNLLPPNHTPDMIERLRALFPGTCVVADDSAETPGTPLAPSIDTIHRVAWPDASDAPDGGFAAAVPRLPGNTVAARVLTSGSTGAPMPHTKSWALLWRNSEAGAARLAEALGCANLHGVSIVATVPAQHMYGFESSVLVALQGGAAFDAARPFYPADISAALERVPRPRVLVTTPLHLRTLLEANVSVPALDLTVCATAPLAPQLAARAEQVLGAPLMEIYGCTEAGQVATRRTTAGAEWLTYAGVQIAQDGETTFVSGGHVPVPTPLADLIEPVDATRFRLLGRANDLINVAGKRSSLAHLNFHLNTIDGVHDGVFWLPAAEPEQGVARLVAFVVAPGVSRERILAALRDRVDPAFLPRRIVWLDVLPRDPTGKLPSARLAALAAGLLGGVSGVRAG